MRDQLFPKTRLHKIEEVAHDGGSILSGGQRISVDAVKIKEERKSQIEKNMDELEFNESPNLAQTAVVVQEVEDVSEEDFVSEGQFDEMKATLVDHLKVIQREKN